MKKIYIYEKAEEKFKTVRSLEPTFKKLTLDVRFCGYSAMVAVKWLRLHGYGYMRQDYKDFIIL